jgi:sugar phosphate isomerase/epimerase
MTSVQNRRQFLQKMAVMGAVLALPDTGNKNNQPRLSFSTLGCPDWNFEQIVEFAASHAYQGIELRGIQRQMDLTQCSVFNTASARKSSLSLMAAKGLQFVNLGSSATLHFAEGPERQKQLEEGKRFIDLAHTLKCPFIRVFPNSFIKEQTKQQTMDLIAKGLMELGDYSRGSGVEVLMETHGDFVHTDDLETLMLMVPHAQVGLTWDFTNMWTITKESPTAMYKRLRKFIRHTHVKDAKLDGDKIQYSFLGKGEVPVAEALHALRNDDYKGFYSFEWEKRWHPELEEPALALADYPIAIKSFIK